MDEQLKTLNEKPTGEAIFEAWHGTTDGWGGCADRANVERVQGWLAEHDAQVRAAARAEAEAKAQRRFDDLNDTFLTMRDRVMGYSSAPPAARLFSDGGHAFEWAATSVRRAAKGEPPLNPPVPITPLRPGDSTVAGWRRYILTCETCGAQFVCQAQATIEHRDDDHLGRVPAPPTEDADADG